MQILNDIKLDYSDVLIQPKRSTLSSRSEVDLFRDFSFKYSSHEYHGIPIMAANMDTVATMQMARELRKHGLCTALHKHYSYVDLISYFNNLEQNTKNPVFYSMGIKESDLKKLISVSSGCQINYIMIDVANGYSDAFSKFVTKIRDMFPNVVICAGNVVTYDMTEELILSGADIVKIGIGNGSVCSTRTQTGIGYPQLSAVAECSSAAHGLGGMVCADGGCRIPGDIAKAFGAGADFVMIGGMLSGHDECGGKLSYENNSNVTFSILTSKEAATCLDENKYFDEDKNKVCILEHGNWIEYEPENIFPQITPTHMEFYGMSSKTAMDKHNGGVAEYRSSEGRTIMVPYRGPVNETILDILGGLRSTCTYTGSKTLKELSKRTTFVRVNRTHEPF